MGLIDDLNDAQLSASASSLNNGCAGCGQDSNTLSDAVDTIEGLSLLAAELWGMLTPEQKRRLEDRYHRAQAF